MAADSLAAMDDADVPAAMAQCGEPLSHAASRRRGRQSRPAYCRRCEIFHRQRVANHYRHIELSRQLLFIRRYFMGAVREITAAFFQWAIWHSRLSGLGRSDLCGARHSVDPFDWL